MENLTSYISKAIEFRAIEMAIAHQYSNQKMRCPVHLSIGQEFWLPFFKKNILGKVRCFASHRSHSLYLALEGDLNSMISELYGLESGCLIGRGGSMHLKDLGIGLEASIPIVGSSLPLALGSAFSAKHSRESILSIAYFGDGACEEGVLHECLNFASVNNLPILFICENNLYSCNTNLKRRQPDENMVRFAHAAKVKTYNIESSNSFEEIDSILQQSIKDAYLNPVFLEIKSYRFFEHCGHLLDKNCGDRTSEEFSLFESKDPLTREISKSVSNKILYQNTFNRIVEICSKIEEKL